MAIKIKHQPIEKVTLYKVDGKTFDTEAEAESHLKLKNFELLINHLKDKIIDCEFISPHFRVTYHAFSAEQLDNALEVANDIKYLVAKIREG